MRRIIHNTTALAACLSLMAPHWVMAQTAAPAEPAQQEPQPEQTAPPPSAKDEAPAATGSDAAPATGPEADATGNAQPPAADAPAADAPAADATAAEDGAPVEAARAADAAAPEPATPAVDDAAPAPDAPAGAVSDATAAAGGAPDIATGTAPGTADAPAASASDTVPGARPDPAAETAGTSPQAEPAQTTMPAAADAASADDGASAPGARQGSTGDARPGDTAAAPAPEGADPAADEGAPAKALAETQDKKASGGAAPASSDAAPATTGTATDAKADPRPSDTAARVPEADAAETDAARDAAAASGAATAAALDDSASAKVTEEQVTEENSRSSDEDFATTLREAMTDPQGQADPRAAEAKSADDDSNDDNGNDGNDLGKALLLGLGGVAVGAMLANNRQVALSSPDRVVVTRPDGSQQLIKDEVALLRQAGSTVATETFDDGSSRTIVTREDGSRVVTIRDADLRVLRRTLIAADGTTTQLIDDTAAAEPVDISSLPAPAAAAPAAAGQLDDDQLREALMRQSAVDRRFTLSQIRNIPQVRALVAPVNIDAITFDTGSAAIAPDQARQLSGLGGVIRDSIAQNPKEIFLIEGHTDTVGSDAANLALSDRRAESVALALTEYFDVPPENLVVQGYGEQFPKVRQEGDVRDNRRASVRRITDLLQTAAN